MTAHLEQVSGKPPDGIWPHALAVDRGRQVDVDAGVAVVGIVLFGVLDRPDDGAVEFDRQLDFLVVGGIETD